MNLDELYSKFEDKRNEALKTANVIIEMLKETKIPEEQINQLYDLKKNLRGCYNALSEYAKQMNIDLPQNPAAAEIKERFERTVSHYCMILGKFDSITSEEQEYIDAVQDFVKKSKTQRGLINCGKAPDKKILTFLKMFIEAVAADNDTQRNDILYNNDFWSEMINYPCVHRGLIEKKYYLNITDNIDEDACCTETAAELDIQKDEQPETAAENNADSLDDISEDKSEEIAPAEAAPTEAEVTADDTDEADAEDKANAGREELQNEAADAAEDDSEKITAAIYKEKEVTSKAFIKRVSDTCCGKRKMNNFSAPAGIIIPLIANNGLLSLKQINKIFEILDIKEKFDDVDDVLVKFAQNSMLVQYKYNDEIIYAVSDCFANTLRKKRELTKEAVIGDSGFYNKKSFWGEPISSSFAFFGKTVSQKIVNDILAKNDEMIEKLAADKQEAENTGE